MCSWCVMVSKIKIRSHFDLMSELTSLLIDELKQCEYSKAEYYKLPEVLTSEENNVPQSIPVSKLTGDNALRAILNSFTDRLK